jgi:hypothetical protein
MPLNLDDATQIVNREFPDGKIQKSIDYEGKFIFQIFTDDPLEGELDPFYSVDQNTGEFSDFSIMTDGDPVKIGDLFLKA